MVMGKKWRKADGARCRRHPRHRQGAGVCPFCLQERLSHLSPSVVRGGKDSEEGEEASSCSEASTMYSSTEGSTGASSASGSATPWAAAFHQEMRCGAARLSLLMRHERVVVDADEVVGVVRRRRERARRTSLWAKLLHATRGGGKKDGCSLAHSKTLDAERSTGAKWILF